MVEVYYTKDRVTNKWIIKLTSNNKISMVSSLSKPTARTIRSSVKFLRWTHSFKVIK